MIAEEINERESRIEGHRLKEQVSNSLEDVTMQVDFIEPFKIVKDTDRVIREKRFSLEKGIKK